MNKIRNLLIVVLSLFLLSGCGTISKVSTLKPGIVQLQINMSDLNYLGDTEINVSYRTYLKFISVIDEVNGAEYNSSDVKIVNLESLNLLFSKQLKRATYKVIEDYPNAAYYQVIYKKTTKDRLFLGSEVKSKALIKAYSFKNEK